jgi:hypothetical protein
MCTLIFTHIIIFTTFKESTSIDNSVVLPMYGPKYYMKFSGALKYQNVPAPRKSTQNPFELDA